MLEQPNQLWFRFGLVLHKVVSAIVMGLVFFLVVSPIGLVMRLCGKRPLALKYDSTLATYWTPRTARTLPPGSMEKQY